ncbi:hypothetical protein NQX30_01700 [Candidatus Persebacteraceae bacterium Df01]|jgi:isocitrate lyase|uniref:Uncharacterized protein n=1 Tax=Candidatus Doriopsillibacter californiensis TaxID=2970740 RepID=A0ABT7QK67_9GAMM|nr:hypothetical protein [Candidatus Persebacteraceae bacterium Df01]
MSTIGYDSWAVDLAEVGAIYPFQGSEVLMTIIGVAFWIGWHVVQIKSENREIAEDIASATPDAVSRSIDRY